MITLGAKKIITVYDGEVGVSYKSGKLLVMTPDRHLIQSADHVFQGFLSTQQQCLHLYQDFDPAIKQSGLLVCETKDFVGIGIKGDVFFRIIDPEKALLVVGKDSIVPLVKDTSEATLNGIIRSTSLADIAQNKEPSARSSHAAKGPLFFDKVHDEFISKLHDSFVAKYGIEITNIRIESFKILNVELSNSISKQALLTAQTATQLSNLAGQKEIATVQQMRDAEVLRIQTTSQAFQLSTETEARNNAKMNTSKAEAEATLTRARADADALLILAEADAKAIRMKSQAESERAEKLSDGPLGGQLAMFQLYSDMVQKSIGGVEKVVYLSSDDAKGTNPMNLFSTSMMPKFALNTDERPSHSAKVKKGGAN
eukprot:TRINITY_DN267_c0_g2_i5.p1 TRINITY_DN267_c0_g2~~TRINITY_DN267_c0_g2_i5.p1  ORF type:complete len:370 (+),score=201.59 TRINITY_DN267_c0_g2_i5:248-1357(+)